MPTSPAPINRTLTGVFSLLCLIAGGIVGVADSAGNIWCGSLIRAGLVLAALWLALPTRGRAAAWTNVSPWWIVLLTGMLILLVRRPIILVPIMAAMLLAIVFIPPRRR